MSSSSNNTPITILWATETGRAKACARRSIRLLQSSHGITNIRGRCAFDDIDFLSLGQQQLPQQVQLPPQPQPQFLILFVSTTGDAEQPSSIENTWNKLLSKSLPKTLFANVTFALFALGDRAYGPDAFCAAGRKLAARLVQLGATVVCGLGYGDDGSLNGGVFADLDVWLEEKLFPVMRKNVGMEESSGVYITTQQGEAVPVFEENLPYEVTIVQSTHKTHSNTSLDEIQEWQTKEYSQYYCNYFKHSCPTTAYQYNHQLERRTQQQSSKLSNNNAPLLGRVTVNERITAEDWMQNTRHIRIHATRSMDNEQPTTSSPGESGCQKLPYQAGDIATILPSNPTPLVDQFLSVLPPSIRAMADDILHIQYNPIHARTTMNYPWPKTCTLRGLLTHCADIRSLPEREDLFALSAYCNLNHADGQDQRDKLISLSETAGAALYGDYIIREKRNWADVFYDFDSMCWEKSNDGGEKMHDGISKGTLLLTISHLLALLPSIAPRHFSIASSPSFMKLQSSSCISDEEGGFELELCVAVVEGTTPFGRSYTGCCSNYLASIAPKDTASASSNAGGSDIVRLWIHPGSFSKLPMNPSMEAQKDSSNHGYFETPVMCIGAGTGIAPLRSLLFEREAQRLSQLGNTTLSPSDESGIAMMGHYDDNILVFGCRKKAKDYYYGSEWETLTNSKRLHLIPAFSRDQNHKLYVQRALREANGGELIARHMLEYGGAVYIAGGSKMARAVKDEIVEALGARLDGGEKDAKRLLNKLKRLGLFSIEAWS